MRFLIIPLGPVRRLLHKGTTRLFAPKELEDLKTDLITPVTDFVDEVYDDTVGDALKKLSERSR